MEKVFIKKNVLTKIKYKTDATIVYTEKNVYVCMPGYEKDLGYAMEFILAKKEDK